MAAMDDSPAVEAGAGTSAGAGASGGGADGHEASRELRNAACLHIECFVES